MKIRDLLQQKMRRFTWTAVGGALIGVLAFQASWLLDIQWVLFVALIAATLSGCAALGSKWLVRCPRCNGNIGAGHSNFSARRLMGRPLACCPYCSVSLDEPTDA